MATQRLDLEHLYNRFERKLVQLINEETASSQHIMNGFSNPSLDDYEDQREFSKNLQEVLKAARSKLNELTYE